MIYKYIVVDDEPLIRRGTVVKLKQIADMAACVAEAGNGLEALQKVEELHPDIVILDMKMPAMDGVELLNHLTERYPALKLIVISGFKSFDYLRHAVKANCVDYLLKPFSAEQIQTVVLQAIHDLEETRQEHIYSEMDDESRDLTCFEYDIQLLTNALMGYEASFDAISSRRLSFLKFAKSFCLNVVCSSRMDPDMKEIVSGVAQTRLAERCVYLKYPSNESLIFVLLAIPHCESQEEELSEVKSFSNELLYYLKTMDGVYSIGVSDIFEGLADMHAAFLQAKEALNQMPCHNPETGLYVYEKQSEKNAAKLFWEKMDEFIFRVETGDTGAVDRLLDELYRKFDETENLSLDTEKYVYYTITSQCAEIFTRYFNTQISQSESVHHIVSDIFSDRQLHAYYRNYFHNLAAILKTQNVFADRDVIEQIKQYVQYHYAQKLSVDWIASLFYLNSNYLSFLFHKKTGMRYTAYVNEVRIEKARNLLLTTDRKTYQIAKMTGFDNIKYFYKVFKKLEGVTPEQYRNSHRDDASGR